MSFADYNNIRNLDDIEDLIMIVGGYIKDFERAEKYTISKLEYYFEKLMKWREINGG